MNTPATSAAQKNITGTVTGGLLYEIKLAFFTISFVVFCVTTLIAAIYISQWFANGSYKAVVFFLDLITVSNVTSKYAIWIIKYV